MKVQQIIARLKEIEGWSLAPDEWRTVGDALDKLESVLPEEDDVKTMRVLALLEPLERRGARLAQARLGAERTPIPAQQREQRNHLIERLTADLRSPEDRFEGAGDGQGESA
ncbi:CATRA system-associated protein [Streptomyces sp. NPDC048484]|uniref:CATRA system-associated protein n=1 Tax=Streptomyces sp. NPDC048484 TaxID=3155146 RepID=UPI0034485EE2